MSEYAVITTTSAIIPVLGYLDDLIIMPLGILNAVRLNPPDVMMNEHRQAAVTSTHRLVSRFAASVVITF